MQRFLVREPHSAGRKPDNAVQRRVKAGGREREREDGPSDAVLTCATVPLTPCSRFPRDADASFSSQYDRLHLQVKLDKYPAKFQFKR